MKRAMPLSITWARTLSRKPASSPNRFTNADVIEMSRAGVPESTILLAIEKTPVKFDVSAEGILALHTAGIGAGAQPDAPCGNSAEARVAPRLVSLRARFQ